MAGCSCILPREAEGRGNIPMPHEFLFQSILSFAPCCESYLGLVPMVAQPMITNQVSPLK